MDFGDIGFAELVVWIGTLASASGAIAWGLFRTFGEKWIEGKFEKQLEEFRHKNQTQLENTRFEFNKAMDRIVKMHGYEYEVFPKLYDLMARAAGMTSSSVSQYQSYAEVERMGQEELGEFLEHTELREFAKRELLARDDKAAYFQNATDWIRFSSAEVASLEFHNYRVLNAIFLPDEFDEPLQQLSDLMRRALLRKRMELQGQADPDRSDDSPTEVFMQNHERHLLDLKAMIRARLWSQQNSDGDTPGSAVNSRA